MKRTAVVEGVGIAVADYESAYVDLGDRGTTDWHKRFLSILSLVHRAGVENVWERVVHALDERGRAPHPWEDAEHYARAIEGEADEIAKWRDEKQRTYPSVYRMRLVVEAEELGAAEAEAYWEARTRSGRANDARANDRAKSAKKEGAT